MVRIIEYAEAGGIRDPPAREAASISGFIQRAVQKSLENEAEFRAMIDQGLAATGGPLTAGERAWARKIA